ncbi:MAG: ead/Ea22-like family protein [Thauera sp.]|jgi:hypothetical protein|nr:ead/Ea22-like family protein [Thauera sp.]
MIDINELRRLAQEVSEWSNCNQAWLDQSEDVPAAVVGHIDEDGNTYPVATIDCDQYYAAHHSLPLAKFYAAANPAAISDLLDRLEAAESDGLEQARMNGMGGEREAALLSKLEAAEKERDALRAKLEAAEKSDAESIAMYRKARDERDALCARIEAMEKQEPVAWLHESRRDSDVVTNAVKHVWGKAAVGSMAAYSIPLYTLPGAKGEEK